MKKLLFTLVVIFSVFNANSQALVDTNLIWSELHGGFVNYLDTLRKTHYIKFSGDTIIDSVHYKKVMRANDEAMANWYHYRDYYITEDSTKKVFLYTNGQKRLIYDFGLNMGDSVRLECGDTTTVAHVDTVYTENILGVDRKVIELTDDLGCWGKWCEKVGNLYIPLLPYYGLCPLVGDSYDIILCVEENDTLIYQLSGYSECYYDTIMPYYNGIELNTIANTLEIYPNPATDNLHITVENNSLDIKVVLYNALGKEMYNDHFTNKITINTRNFLSGVYFVKLTNSTTNIVRKVMIR